jgi:hypothetical protein
MLCSMTLYRFEYNQYNHSCPSARQMSTERKYDQRSSTDGSCRSLSHDGPLRASRDDVRKYKVRRQPTVALWCVRHRQTCHRCGNGQLNADRQIFHSGAPAAAILRCVRRCKETSTTGNFERLSVRFHTQNEETPSDLTFLLFT